MTSNTPEDFRFPGEGPLGALSGRLLMRRRRFLEGLAAGAGLLLSARLSAATTPLRDGTPATLSEAVMDSRWPTLAAVQAHLLPSESNAPGAREINATAYLRNALEAPDADPEEKKFLFAGADWLRGKTAQDFSARQFGEIAEGDREKLLRHMASGEDGRNWIALLLFYVLEALLCDPVYGGNPDAIGWKWLDYIPGYPRPPADRRYFELLGQ